MHEEKQVLRRDRELHGSSIKFTGVAHVELISLVRLFTICQNKSKRNDS
jgi:hypothetical protein